MLIDFRKLFPKYGINPTGVLHVGANVGEEAPVYDELGITDVIWIEANPEIFVKLEDNIKKYPRHVALNYCVSDVEEDSQLHISNNGSQSSSILPLGTHLLVHPDVHYIKDIPVKLYRLDTILKGSWIQHFNFLNIDIQGAELKALKGMGALLDQFKWVYLEVNWKELYVGCALFSEVEAFMKEKGFKVAEYKECGRTSWGDCLFIRK